MPTIVWFLLGFGLYLLGVLTVLGLMRGATMADEFEADVRAGRNAPPSGPGAPRR